MKASLLSFASHHGTSWAFFPFAVLVVVAAVFGPAADIVQAQKILPPNGIEGQLFGFSLAAARGRVVVGAPHEGLSLEVFNNPGSAYVFDASGTFVRELVPRSASERRRDDSYGRSVGASGNIIVVGAPRADDIGFFAGEVFVFNAATGAQITKLVPTGTRRNPADGSAFGSAVAVSSNRIVVGAPGTFANGATRIGANGAIYLYDATTRRLITRVTPPEAQPKDNVGHSVAIAGNYVVAGAPFDSGEQFQAGAVYVFNSSNGSQLFRLTANDAGVQDLFGFAVSISGGLIAIGAPFDDDQGTSSGSVYLFDARTGIFINKFVANDGGPLDQFGISVDLVGDNLAVGAWGDNGGAGSTYIFDVTTGTQLSKLEAPDASPLAIFGRSVALTSTGIIAGAPRDGEQGEDAGAAYQFELPIPMMPLE